MTAKDCIFELKQLASKERAKINASFFKTGKGEYGEGDIFIGVTVPQNRAVCKQFIDLSYDEISQLLTNEIHEVRLAALLILTEQVKNKPVSKKHFSFIKKHYSCINNWDLVDQIAPRVIGKYVFEQQNTNELFACAKSKNMWVRRIAIVSTQYLIKQRDVNTTLKLSEQMFSETHDLMHKAVGWMLREAWKVDAKKVEKFLTKHISYIPRTTLRYAIERMEEKKRKSFLHK